MDMDLIELWSHMNNLVRGVVLILTLQALGCIAVVIDRVLLLALSNAKSRKFAAEAGPMLASGDYSAARRIAKKHDGSHLASLIGTGVEVFEKRKAQGHDSEKAADFVRRALERKGENLSSSLHRGMNILASTGSTAPFIGLLGTVLGILNAFTLIAEEGSGGMGTIGAAIGEALIVTGYGLMVAIPAVLLFNWLNSRIDKYEAGLANAGSELVDQLEGGQLPAEDDEAPATSASTSMVSVA
ncbi:MAG: MotA/TolQ/ExbB proton channel family protein [Myxococcota bacterium]